MVFAGEMQTVCEWSGGGPPDVLFQFSCLAEMMPLVYTVQSDGEPQNAAPAWLDMRVVLESCETWAQEKAYKDLRAFLHRTSGCCERASSDAWKHRRKSNRPSPSVRVVCDLMSDVLTAGWRKWVFGEKCG